MTADQTSAMGARGRGAPPISFGGHTIIVQGDASEKTLAAMDQKLAAANKAILDHITRTLPQIPADSQQGN